MLLLHHQPSMGSTFLSLLLHLLSLLCLSSSSHPSIPPTDDINGRFQSLDFANNYATLWGEPKVLDDPAGTVQLRLDRHTGGGFASHNSYYHAFYSASIKLPTNYTAGVVLAFYTSNANSFPNNHDELDFEFLGNLPGQAWKLQTNIYGNGSVSRGREERFDFWFDPTADFHNYSILWNHKHVVFLVDNLPIREMRRSEELKGDYPRQPMAVYATIWDGSGWATEGGRYPVNYEYEPFVATFRDLKLGGCSTDPIQEKVLNKCGGGSSRVSNPARGSGMGALTDGQLAALDWVRGTHMYYSYCSDRGRYPRPLPECRDEPLAIHTNGHGYTKGRRHAGRHHHQRSATTRGRGLIEDQDNYDIKFSDNPPSLRLI